MKEKTQIFLTVKKQLLILTDTNIFKLKTLYTRLDNHIFTEIIFAVSVIGNFLTYLQKWFIFKSCRALA